MAKEETGLSALIDSGKPMLLAELSPPRSSKPAHFRETVNRYSGKVHAVGINDNRDGVCMSALAAASLAVAEGVETILYMVTRDRNRIALIADCLGADALGVRNILCTSGTHQTLANYRAARNVFDIDSVQFLEIAANLPTDGSIVGEENFEGTGPFCLGAVAAPFADPLEMQLIRLSKKVAAGAHFMITQPVFDVDRFEIWWKEVVSLGIHEKVAILAGIRPLLSADDARTFAARRPDPVVPDALIERVGSSSDEVAQRATGVDIALETIDRISALDGLRGFEISGDDTDTVLKF